MSFGGVHVYRPTKNKQIEKILDFRAKKLVRDIIIVSTLLLVGSVFYFIFPLICFFTTGEHRVVADMFLPFVDNETNWGYLMNTLYVSKITFTVCVVTVGNECTSIMMSNYLWAIVDLIKHSVSELEELQNRKGTKIEQKIILKNIYEQIEQLNGYINEWMSVFYIKSILSPIILSVAISAAIFSGIVVSNTNFIQTEFEIITEIILVHLFFISDK